ncbi:phosphoinositide-3-kinase-interacting protein 1 [Mustelus asterias]
MCAELGYQFLLSDSALSCVLKAALENAYPKIRGRMPVTAEVLPHRKRTVLPGTSLNEDLNPITAELETVNVELRAGQTDDQVISLPSKSDHTVKQPVTGVKQPVGQITKQKKDLGILDDTKLDGRASCEEDIKILHCDLGKLNSEQFSCSWLTTQERVGLGHSGESGIVPQEQAEGQAMAIGMMTIIIVLGAGITLSYIYKRGQDLKKEQEQRASEREMHRIMLPLSAFSNPNCELVDEITLVVESPQTEINESSERTSPLIGTNGTPGA